MNRVATKRIAMTRVATAALLAAPCMPGVARAQGPVPAPTPAPASAHTWTIDDMLLAEDSRDFTISPDGEKVAWVRSAMSTVTNRVASNLYLSSRNGGVPIALTSGTASVSTPRWSPDGSMVAFLGSQKAPQADSSRNAKPAPSDSSPAETQLWVADARTHAVRPVTSLEREMDDYAWIGRDTIIFLAEVPPTPLERAATRRHDDSRAVDDPAANPPDRLYLLDVRSGHVAPLTTNDDWITAFAVSPDGRYVVSTHDRSLSWGYDQRIPPITILTDRTTGSRRQLYDGTHVNPDNLTWARDGAGFYFTNDSTTSPRWRTATIGVLDYYEVATGRTLAVDHAWARGISGHLRAVPNGVIARLNDGVHTRLATYTRTGARFTRRFLTGARVANSYDFDVSPDGRAMAYRYSRANVPPQLFAAALRDDTITGDVQITDLNPGFRDKPQPTVEIVHWAGARGDTVEGILTYPIGYVPGRRYPLIASIHGGPALADYDEWKQIWSYPRLLLNQRGALTLQVNYHGSSGYGLRWVESICCGNIYTLETPDVERGVDYVIARGLADSTRLGLLGHSYGAIITADITTRDTRYRAASAAAGDVEWFSDWGNVSFGKSYDEYYFGASPWDSAALYVRKSPAFRLKNVRTPTIIYQGTEDRNVPSGEALTYFRAVQQAGNAPVRLVLFPGEPHMLRRYPHQHRKVEEDLAWFERYLFAPDSTSATSQLTARNGAPRSDAPVTASPATMRP